MEQINNIVTDLAVILIFSYALSLLARVHWIPDLFSHFKIQYFAGGLILFTPLLYFQLYVLAIPVLIVSAASFRDIKRPLSKPQPSKTPDALIFRVMQYNKYLGNRQYPRIINYFNKISKDTDLIILQEVIDCDIVPLIEGTKGIYPHTMPLDGMRPNEVLILSKHPIENLEMKKVAPEFCDTYGIRFEITLPQTQKIIVIYTVHTEVPKSREGQNTRNIELIHMAQWIAQDKHPDIIFMGDWNTTPYSPVFSDVLNISRLRYRHGGILPESTWPSVFLLPILKIPIDHILFSPAMRLQKIKKGPALGSDHHSLSATFALE